MVRECPSAKARHSSLRSAKASAHGLARDLNAAGRYSTDLYAYRCADCRFWHTTKRATWDGVSNRLVFYAPTRALQDWAMGRI